MQFSLATLSDLLSEFQKYLSSRIPQATYYALGLLVVVLGALTGYIVGWRTVVNDWNGLDVFFKIVLSTAAGLTFFLLAYILGSLQGAVERWFQGDWPRWFAMITGQVRRHRTLWQERDGALQELMGLYSQISAVLNEVTQWALVQAPLPSVVQTKHPLPQYHIITEQNIELSTINILPDGAIQSRANVIGTMVQHPIDKGTALTIADIIYLPAELRDAAILAITTEASQIPGGLVPGDMVKVYLPGHHHRTSQFSASLIIGVQSMTREANGTKTDFIHLTLAVIPADVDKYVSLTKENELRIVRIGTSSRINLPTPVNNQNRVQPQPPSGDVSQIPNKIQALLQPYEQGQLWLKRLRSGFLESFSQRRALDEVNDLLSSLSSLFDPSAPNRDQLLEWSRQVNDYRNKWIDLLQQAFKEIEYRVDQNQKFFYLHYPATIEMVAPTSVGNIFRAVDSYCDTLYGLDTALVLPRLQIVMEQDTRDQLSKAHDQLSLLEWLYLTSITIGITGAIFSFMTHHYLLACLCWLLALPVPQMALYRALAMAALDYAAALRLAYDRERGKVISMVGCSLPSLISQEQEKLLWKEIQQWWVYGTPPGEYILNLGDASNEKNT